MLFLSQSNSIQRMLRKLWDGVLFIADKCLSLDGKIPEKLDKILILQLQHLGDSLVFTPALRAIRKTFPEARIDMIVNKASYEVFKSNPNVDGFYKVDYWLWGSREKRYFRFLKSLINVIKQVRRNNYDCVVLCINQQAFKYSLIAFLTGIKCRIGFNRTGKGFLNTVQVPYDEEKSYIQCNLYLAQTLGASPNGSYLEFPIDKTDEEYIENLLREEGINEQDILIGIHASSKQQSNLWFIERWAELADKLIQALNTKIVFTGTEAEREYIIQILNQMEHEAISFVGKTSLTQLAALAKKCRLFISLGTGPWHIAASTQIPIVTIMSSQDLPHRWMHHLPSEYILSKDVPCSPCLKERCESRECMRLIEVDEVMDACVGLLSRAEESVRAMV